MSAPFAFIEFYGFVLAALILGVVGFAVGRRAPGVRVAGWLLVAAAAALGAVIGEGEWVVLSAATFGTLALLGFFVGWAGRRE